MQINSTLFNFTVEHDTPILRSYLDQVAVTIIRKITKFDIFSKIIAPLFLVPTIRRYQAAQVHHDLTKQIEYEALNALGNLYDLSLEINERNKQFFIREPNTQIFARICEISRLQLPYAEFQLHQSFTYLIANVLGLAAGVSLIVAHHYKQGWLSIAAKVSFMITFAIIAANRRVKDPRVMNMDHLRDTILKCGHRLTTYQSIVTGPPTIVPITSTRAPAASVPALSSAPSAKDSKGSQKPASASSAPGSDLNPAHKASSSIDTSFGSPAKRDEKAPASKAASISSSAGSSASSSSSSAPATMSAPSTFSHNPVSSASVSSQASSSSASSGPSSDLKSTPAASPSPFPSFGSPVKPDEKAPASEVGSSSSSTSSSAPATMPAPSTFSQSHTPTVSSSSQASSSSSSSGPSGGMQPMHEGALASGQAEKPNVQSGSEKEITTKLSKKEKRRLNKAKREEEEKSNPSSKK